MKTARSIFLVLIFIYLSSTVLHAQDSVLYRKLYLHTDREQYFLGDTIWYKGYYLDGHTNKFIPGLISMYADLINEKGQAVNSQVLALDNGASSGAIHIPVDLEAGIFMLRAFTDFQKQIGEDAFFHKELRISKLESFVESAEQAKLPKAEEVYVDFLPEGGMLLEGIKNTLALKAIDEGGKGVPVEGEILDGQGMTVVTFKSSYKGMGSFAFTPEKGERYTVRMTDYPDFHYQFNEIVKEGIKIGYEDVDGDNLHFSVSCNSASLLGKTHYFAISFHGDVIFHQKFVLKKNSVPITVTRDALPAGINKMVLLDEHLQPISERLYFSSNYEVNEIRIKPDRKSYDTRSKVRLRLSDGREMTADSWSNLSLSVVDEFASDKDGPSMNILSWLLVDSELKGMIESPNDYFLNDPALASAAKLDLLMLTQGWSRYVWNSPEEFLAANAKDDEGFSLWGEVQKAVGKNPVSEGTVELKIYSSSFMHSDTVELDRNGKFVFRDVSFQDTASVFVQARNRKERLAFELKLDPIFDPFPTTSEDFIPKKEAFEYKQAEIYQKQYDNLQALKEYAQESGGFYLDEVSITERRREPDDGHFRIYAKPSNSIKLPEKDIGAVSIFDYIKSHFSGVIVTASNTVIIGGPSSFAVGSVSGYETQGGSISNSGAMLLLDGIQVSSELLESVSMNQIDVIEILKFPHEFGIYGTRAANGVVAVYTKKGVEPDYSKRNIPGTIAEKLEGYSSIREFYSPRYSPETLKSGRPDHRIVLHWNPNIFTEKGRATVDFYTSDDISRYKVYIEGITREGMICLGTGEIEVDRRNDRLAPED